jgi:hypothetical protein
MASRKAMIMPGWALWGLAWVALAAADTAQVIQVDKSPGDKSEVVLDAGRRHGLALDSEVNLLRPGSPIVHPLTGQVLGRPQEPVGVARVFEVGDQQSRAVVEKSYSPPQVGDEAEYQRPSTREREAAAAPAVGHAQEEEAHGHRVAEPGVGAAREESHGKAGGAEGEVQQRLKDLERSVEEYHSSSKTLKAYPVFAQRVWDEISTMKSYLVSLDERLVQLEEQQSQDRHHLSSVVGGDGAGEEGMREFTVRYAPDTQVKLKVAGKTLLISVDHDSLRVQEEGAAAPLAGDRHGEEGGEPAPAAIEEHETAVAHVEAPAHGGEEAHKAEEEEEHHPAPAHGGEEEAHGGEGHEAETPWYQSPWVIGIGVLTLGLVAGVVSWLIKRRYEEESEELEADYLEEEDEDEDEEED